MRRTLSMPVVYFDHPMGALHTVRWSKSSLWAFEQVVPSFSLTNGKSVKNEVKLHIKRGPTVVLRQLS